MNGHMEVILLILFGVQLVYSMQFNRNWTGVTFNPMVKQNSTALSCLSDYSLPELKTMLEVVSTKFSKVATKTVGANYVDYKARSTYYNKSCIVARTGEAAALINKERSQSALSITIGVTCYTDELGGESRTLTEAQVALESAMIANYIFPGTVVGLQLYINANFLTNSEMSPRVSKWLAYIKNRTSETGNSLKVGVLAFVDQKFSLEPKDTFHPNSSFKNIFQAADFLTLNFYAKYSEAKQGPTESFSIYSKLLLRYRDLRDVLNSGLILMGCTGWSSFGMNNYESNTNLAKYWKAADEFATKNKFIMWLDTAFDNPSGVTYNPNISHYGWWRLSSNQLAGDVSGYTEKISGENTCIKNCTRSGVKSWGWTIIIFTVVLLTAFLCKVTE